METRRSPRVPISLSIISKVDLQPGQKFSLSEGDIFKAEAADISISGIGVTSKYFLPAGLYIKLEIDGKPFGLKEPMKIKGRVRYSKFIRGQGYRCGLEFTDILPEYTAKIAEFINIYERRKDPRIKLAE